VAKRAADRRVIRLGQLSQGRPALHRAHHRVVREPSGWTSAFDPQETFARINARPYFSGRLGLLLTPRILRCARGRDDCSAAGRYDTGDRPRATDDVAQAIGGGNGRHGGLNGRVDRVEIRHELGGFDRERVRGIKDVLVAHLE
jgi:hypothetical protein